MRVFARPSGLDRLSLEARVVYSGFCVFLLLGYITSVWLYHSDALGISPDAATAYYLGSGDESPAWRPKDGGRAGPSVSLPAAGPAAGADAGAPLQARALRLAKPPRQVMETFHFHLFSVATVLLVISHLFMMCSLSRRLKAGMVAIGFAVTFVHLITPPLIRFAGAPFASLMFPSALAMAATWFVMTAWPLVEMWLLLPPQRRYKL